MEKRARSPRRSGRLSALVVAGLLLTACGSSPTAGTGGGGGSGGSGGSGGGGGGGQAGGNDGCNATERIAEINAELEGLSATERREALIALAEEEGGQVSFYGSPNPVEAVPLIDMFQEQTGISVRHYRASAETVMQRLLEEHSAGHRGADAVAVGSSEFLLLDREGYTATFESPLADEIFDGGVQDTWIGLYRTMRIPFWNTDRIPDDEAPETWEEVLLDYPGELIFDPGDWDWFGQLVKDYFIAERGMTEEEAVELFRESARGAVQVSGHALGMELVAAGEFGMTAISYHHGLARIPDAAPVDWAPVEPVIYNIVGIGISECAQAPAAGLLFGEFAWGIEAQEMLFGLGRTTANVNVAEAWPEEYDQLSRPITAETISSPEREKWEGYWEEILRETGLR